MSEYTWRPPWHWQPFTAGEIDLNAVFLREYIIDHANDDPSIFGQLVFDPNQLCDYLQMPLPVMVKALESLKKCGFLSELAITLPVEVFLEVRDYGVYVFGPTKEGKK